MVCKFFNKKIFRWCFYRCLVETLDTQDKSGIEYKIMSNQQLAEKLHKLIVRKFEKRKVYSSFIDNMWGADLSDMQLISKFNKRICFLLCVIDIFSK